MTKNLYIITSSVFISGFAIAKEKHEAVNLFIKHIAKKLFFRDVEIKCNVKPSRSMCIVDFETTYAIELKDKNEIVTNMDYGDFVAVPSENHDRIAKHVNCYVSSWFDISEENRNKLGYKLYSVSVPISLLVASCDASKKFNEERIKQRLGSMGDCAIFQRHECEETFYADISLSHDEFHILLIDV